MTLPFFADYILNKHSPNKISAAEAFRFVVFPDIALVLRKIPIALADASIYGRIGILKISYEIEVSYGIDLAKSSVRTKIATI